MSENFVIKTDPEDPFRTNFLQLADKYEHISHEEIDGNIYKKTKILFFKKGDISSAPLLGSEPRRYANTKVLAFKSAKDNSLQALSGFPSYSHELYRNPRLTAESSSFGLQLFGMEINKDTFYTGKLDGFGKRNVVFNSNTPMIGSPDADYKNRSFCNIINLSYEPTTTISEKIRHVDGVSDFSIYERFMILVGHYSNAITTIENSDTLTLESVVRNYSYPFLEDIYYTIKNVSDEGISEDVDLSYSDLEKDMLDQIKKSVSFASMNYEDIWRNNETVNENLFFKVEKWISDTPSKTPDQIYFIPATSQEKLFIDTQLSENQTYYYRVTAYYASIEQEYYFSDYKDNEDGTEECIAYVRPLIFINNMVVFEDKIINKPSPPMVPFVSFHNKASENNKIKIYLELQKGEEHAHVIPFPGQENIFGSHSILSNNEVRFEYNRAEGGKFEIYRMSTKPESYEEFLGNMIGSFENTDKAENMVIMDNVRPNKKYYYTFRAYNQYGSFSNPSPVYEVELLKDADKSRVLVNTVLIIQDQESIEQTFDLNFRSLLGIYVADQQISFNLEDLRELAGGIPTFRNNLDIVSLGNTTDGGELLDKIWGDKFKFRIRSNDSGKIIDFNVKVDLIKEESEEDFS